MDVSALMGKLSEWDDGEVRLEEWKENLPRKAYTAISKRLHERQLASLKQVSRKPKASRKPHAAGNATDKGSFALEQTTSSAAAEEKEDAARSREHTKPRAKAKDSKRGLEARSDSAATPRVPRGEGTPPPPSPRAAAPRAAGRRDRGSREHTKPRAKAKVKSVVLRDTSTALRDTIRVASRYEHAMNALRSALMQDPNNTEIARKLRTLEARAMQGEN